MLWFYSKDEANNFNVDIPNDNDFKCFEYKVRLYKETIKLMKQMKF